ncbi:hypothetical protein [Massilia niastensis]|uniref:hypothetical protein n=1 Tax=Massilia niastensis TaxID=544911 RepID=UPI0003705732|nr:hypothetical protein [Massilia niastensis]
MSHRPVFRILLSLVLLLSQHMAMAHALSHWNGQLAPAAQRQADDSELSSAFAHDRSCAQCLGFAQLGAPLASPARQCPPHGAGAALVRAAGDLPCRAQRLRAFDSRGPPSFEQTL